MTVDRPRRTILVTGACGYLGGRICQSISSRKNLALIGTSRRQRPRNWCTGEYFQFDLGSQLHEIDGLLNGVDTVVHLAALDAAGSARDTVQALNVNTGASMRLAKAAAAAGVKRFIYMSTAHVYGFPLMGLVDERTATRPANVYAITHRAAEDFILASSDTHEMHRVVLRLSNGIGPPASPDIVQWDRIGNALCLQAVQSDRLRLTTSGEQWLNFIGLSDVVAAVLHFADVSAELIGDGLFNLGGPVSLRVIDVAKLVAEQAHALFGNHLQILRPDGTTSDPLWYSTEKIKATGFRTTATLAAEIRATLTFCAEAKAAGEFLKVSE